MTGLRWSAGRILLIWGAWPVIVIGVLFTLGAMRRGFSLDLLHGPQRWIAMLSLLGPPVAATLLWGRR